jgi:collagen type III alpha
MQFNSLMPGQQQQQQRQPPPLMNGQSQQQRGPGPFQSPTMAHSPQNNAGTPGQPGSSNQQQHGQQQQGQPSMGQFAGPSPNMAHAHAHMSRTDMLPPNGAINPMGPGPQQQQLPQQAGGPPTPGYSQQQQQQQGGGRPPSRTNTPGGMMHSSPSLVPRQAPPSGMGGGAVSEINAELMHIPQNLMTTLKREMGLADKDLTALTLTEKVRFSLSFSCV